MNALSDPLGLVSKNATSHAPAPSRRMDRRSFIKALSATGLAMISGPSAANTDEYHRSVSVIKDIFDRHFFDPTWMASQQAQTLFSDLTDIADASPEPEQFHRDFAQLFRQIGLSHVVLSAQHRSAAELGHHFDSVQVGVDAVSLGGDQSVARLSVRTFMGQDTGPRITAAFEEIISNDAKGLIIDLRDNPGGAFAMRHLVGHCIPNGVDAGVLLGRGWPREAGPMPERAQIEALEPWHGTSVVGLWNHLATHDITRVQFLPMRPMFHGPIAILINGETQSAAELVAEVLQSTRGAVLIGETSAGALLVQKPFDVGDQFTLFLPVADYVSHGSGRIEGVGLVPDMAASAQDAQSVALSFLSEMRNIERKL
ncbi:S41 family peptidase [Aestuariibius sp. HNIBRBA575]|uniref:S41 family peptidase n=1 Tax=Aestuariibius sp. HNIBRBA575 TaxID=3233343 RepID=UPI0034A3AEBA